MKDENKTKAQLIEELKALRNEVGKLKVSSQAILEEKRKYETILDNTDDYCFETDLAGRITFCNTPAYRTLGYEREEYLNLNRNDRYESLDEAKRVFEIYNHIYRTGKSIERFHYNLRKKDGTVQIVEVSASLIRDTEGKPVGFQGIARDVTEKKKAEEELKRYKVFVENVEDGCYEMNVQGRYTFVNEALCRRSGFDREELLSMNPADLYPSKEEANRVRILFEDVYESGIPKKFVYPYLKKNGEVYNIENSVSLIRDTKGNPTGFRGISLDVTERLKMEQEKERYRNFLDSIDDYCFESDLKGNLIFANEKTLRLFGISREQMQPGQINYQKMLPRERAEKYRQVYLDVYRSGESAHLYDLEINLPGENHRYMDMTISLIRNEDGKPLGFRVISRDVTGRKKMEEEQARLRAQLTQSEKLESIGTLAGGIAHDFNNLLMGIQGYAALMLMDIDADHPHYEPLKIIENQVKSGADLTKQLLGYARGGRYEVKPTAMNDLIQRTASMFGRTKRDIRMHQKFAGGLWQVAVDQGQMEQVLLNLFVNASQAMPGGGALYLETQNVMLDEAYVKPHAVAPGSYVKISVTDTGIGMDEKTRQRIFEPFFTTKDMGHGAGLGLASAYGIIKGYNGIITCYSELGHGTTFNIYLPAMAKKAVRQEQREAAVVHKQMTILLVDDEKTITDVTGAMLSKLGHTVIVARGGREAVVSYRVHRERIDLIVMDMIMPDMSGGEAIEHIKSINPDARILLSSGYSIDGMAREIMDRCGVQGFIQKPFQINQLVDKINEMAGVQKTEDRKEQQT
jgi:PAS domain S-box-containing protein